MFVHITDTRFGHFYPLMFSVILNSEMFVPDNLNYNWTHTHTARKGKGSGLVTETENRGAPSASCCQKPSCRAGNRTRRHVDVYNAKSQSPSKCLDWWTTWPPSTWKPEEGRITTHFQSSQKVKIGTNVLPRKPNSKLQTCSGDHNLCNFSLWPDVGQNSLKTWWFSIIVVVGWGSDILLLWDNETKHNLSVSMKPR